MPWDLTSPLPKLHCGPIISELVLELNVIEITNSALHARLMAKNKERLELVAIGKSRDRVHDGPRAPSQ